MVEHGNFNLDLNDSLAIKKYSIIQGINRISDLVSKNREDKYNLVTFIASIFLGILANIFVNRENWILVLVMAIILLLIVIWRIIHYNKERNELRNIARPLLLDSKRLNMGLPNIDQYL